MRIVEKPIVFLSYSRPDQEFVRRVAEVLNAHAITVWHDEWESSRGSPLLGAIEDGVQRADYVIPFVSSAAGRLAQTKQEYSASGIRQIESQRRVVILPALLDDSELPPFLSARIFADFRSSFSYGCTKLLEAVLSFDAFNDVDLAFAEVLHDLDELTDDASRLPSECIRNALSKLRKDRKRSVFSSAAALGRPMSIRDVEKWLKITARDLTQHRFCACAEDTLDEAANLTSVGLAQRVLDRLFDEYYLARRTYGATRESYHDLDFIAADIRRIVAIITDSPRG